MYRVGLLLLVGEVVNYTLGDLLSDNDGILGFFLGLSLLQCLKQIWRALVQSAPMTFLTRCIHDSRHRSVSFKEINEKFIENFKFLRPAGKHRCLLHAVRQLIFIQFS